MRKNVASQVVGAQVVSATDGSAFTGSVTCRVTLDGGTQATGTVGSGACTHEGNGYHTYTPSQAETNGNLAAYTFTGTGAVPVTVQVYTVGYDPTAAQLPANVTQFGGSNGTFASGRPEVNTTHAAGTAWGSGAITAGAIASNAITDAKIASGAFTAAKFASGAFDAVWSVGTRVLTAATNLTTALATPTNITAGTITTVTTLTNAPSDSSGVTTLLSRLSATRAGYLDNLSAGAVALEASVQALITTIGASAAGVASAVWSAGTRLLTAGTNISLAKGTGVTGFTDLDAGGVRSAVGLASANLDTQLATIDTVVDAIKVTTDKIDDTVEDQGGGTYGFTAAALAEAPSGGGGGGATPEQIAEAVWDEALSAHTTPGSAGDTLGNVATGTPPTADAIADEVQTRTIAAVTLVNGLGSNVITAAALATDAVTEIQSGLATASSVAAVEADTQDLQSRLPSALVSGRIAADAVAISGSTSAADAVEANIASLDAAVSTRATPAQVNAEADQALADVGLTTTITGRVDAAISTRLASASYTAPPSAATNASAVRTELTTELGRLDAAVSTRSTLSQAQVASEIADALTVDVVADSVPADGSRPTIAQAAYMLVQFMTERQVSGTTMTVRKPDGSTQLFALTLDDDTAPTSVTRSA